MGRNSNGTFSAKFSKKQELEICKEYLEDKKTYLELSKKYECSTTTIRNILIRNGFSPRTKSEAKRISDKTQCEIKENAFEIIDKDSAYWLGALMSDGCVVETKPGRYRLEFGVKYTDIKWVQDFSDWIGWKGKIQIHDNSGFSGSTKIARVQINNDPICKSLIKLGCIERKSLQLKEIPNIPAKYKDDFLRGFIDGDGSIETERGRLSVIGNKSFLEQIGDYFNCEYRICQKTENTYQMFFNQSESAQILKRLYENSKYRLERKYQIAEKYF